MHRELTIRDLVPSELPELIALFRRAYAGYAGFAERSVEDFRWRYLDRPDVGTRGVLVVEDGHGSPQGYIVVGTSGTIWEYAVDPATDRREAADLLIMAAEGYLLNLGVDEITLHAPIGDADMTAALQRTGYGDGSPIHQYLSFIDLQGVVEKILIKHRDGLPRGLEVVEFVLTNPRAWHPERFSVKTDAGAPRSSPPRSASISIRASVEALVEVIVGAESPRRAVARHQIVIVPLRKTAVGLQVLHALHLRDPFFFARSDVT